MTKEFKERPMLFNGAMVRAVLSGSKTQTRRVIKKQPEGDRYLDWTCCQPLGGFGCDIIYGNDEPRTHCPYGQVGDQLWVRETFQPIFAEGVTDWGDVDYKTGEGYAPIYPATDKVAEFVGFDGDITTRCTPSIHMPRWASRIQLEITGIRVERLNDCSEADAKAEGVKPDNETSKDVMDGLKPQFQYKEPYMRLWESINGEGSWSANPWVWVIEFKVIKP